MPRQWPDERLSDRSAGAHDPSVLPRSWIPWNGRQSLRSVRRNCLRCGILRITASISPRVSSATNPSRTKARCRRPHSARAPPPYRPYQARRPERDEPKIGVAYRTSRPIWSSRRSPRPRRAGARRARRRRWCGREDAHLARRLQRRRSSSPIPISSSTTIRIWFLPPRGPLSCWGRQASREAESRGPAPLTGC